MKELITANLDIWSAAVTAKTSGAGRSSGNKGAYGINKLRELILELAVRGKLVPQDPYDEPASELLKRIQQEKQILFKGRSTKKPKNAAELNVDIMGDLPIGWVRTKLADVAFINPRNMVEDNVSVSFIPMTLIGTLFNGNHDQEVRKWSEVKQGFTHFAEGDIAVAKITPCFENSKACVFSGLVNGIGAGTTELHVVRPVSGTLNPRYVLAYLKSPRFLLVGESRMTGTAGQKRLPKEFVESNLFPLPPLAEQHRIVAKVDELMALCDQLESVQANSADAHEKLVSILLDALTEGDNFTESWARVQEHFDVLFTTPASIDNLKQTLLQLAVMGKLVPQEPSDEPASELFKRIQAEKAAQIADAGNRKQKELASDGFQVHPYDVPSGWEWRHMDDLFMITGGVTLGRKLVGQKLVSRPYLRVANVQRGHLDLDHIKDIEVPITEVEKYALNQGDLLITEGGDWDKVGRTAVWNNELPECLHQNHVFKVRPVLSDWLSRWSEMYLNSASAREYFAGSSKQTTNLASINMTQLRGCAFALPPLAEQHRIVAKVDELMMLCDQLKSQLVEAGEQQRQLADVMVDRAVA